MDRIVELERCLENILELFEVTGNSYTVETLDGDIIEVSKPLCQELDMAEIVLYGERDDATGAY